MKKNHEARSPKRKDWHYPDITRYQQTQSKRIATKLLMSYRHLVRSSARKLSRNRPDLYEDLYQVGQISLLRSLERYDQAQGSSFEAYARKSMKGSMMNYLRDKAWHMPMPRWMKEQWGRVQRSIDELTVEQEKTPSIVDIAEHSNLPLEMTKKILAGQANSHVASLDAPLTSETGEFTLLDVIGTEAKEYQAVENRLDIGKAWTLLSTKEKWILHLNYMKGETQRNIANRLGVSQMTVSRTLKRALKKLKQGITQPQTSMHA